MKCTCGTSYSENDDQWQRMIVTPRTGREDVRHYAVFAAMCPDCGEVGIKCDFSYDAYDLARATVSSADHIFPPLSGSSRTPVSLEGVPERIASDYKKAIEALDSPNLYSFANVLVRRSLEATLELSGFGKGNGKRSRLDDLIKALEADPQGTPKGILDNLDAIRKLGNYDAHIVDDEHGKPIEPSPEETSWNVTLFERFITHFFVEPAQDKKMRESLPAR